MPAYLKKPHMNGKAFFLLMTSEIDVLEMQFRLGNTKIVWTGPKTTFFY